MIAQKEKAQLVVDVLEKFAPYMDQSTDLFQKMGVLITHFGSLVESFAELPDDKKLEFMNFIRTFNTYIEHASTNYSDLRNFYSYMTRTTNVVIQEYKAAIGVD